MKKPNLNQLIKNAQTTLGKHSPEILTGLGIAGMVTTTVLAVKATPKALSLIEEKKYEEDKSELTPVETVKATWKCYIPAAVTCTTSIVCLIFANTVHAKRTTVLATAYKLSETALTEYREKVIETIGEKKEKEVRDKVDRDKIETNPVSKTEVIITEKGNTLCYDAISGRYFKSDIEQIKKIENILNRRMMSDMYVSLNEFYDELGLEHTEIGAELGWNIDRGLIDVNFSSQIANDGTPCIVVNYNIAPKYGYSDLAY